MAESITLDELMAEFERLKPVRPDGAFTVKEIHKLTGISRRTS